MRWSKLTKANQVRACFRWFAESRRAVLIEAVSVGEIERDVKLALVMG